MKVIIPFNNQLDYALLKTYKSTYNFTAIELSKVPFFIEAGSSSIRKFESLTESSKVSKFSKEEFADEINAKVAEGVLDKTREMAKSMREQGIPDSTIAVISGLSEEEIRKL